MKGRVTASGRTSPHRASNQGAKTWHGASRLFDVLGRLVCNLPSSSSFTMESYVSHTARLILWRGAYFDWPSQDSGLKMRMRMTRLQGQRPRALPTRMTWSRGNMHPSSSSSSPAFVGPPSDVCSAYCAAPDRSVVLEMQGRVQSDER